MQTKTEEVLAIIDNVIRLQRSALGPLMVNELERELTRNNPAFFLMDNLKRRNPRKYKYTVMPPKIITSIYMDEHTVYVPRACRTLINTIAAQNGREVSYRDDTITFDRDVNMRMADDFKVREHQKKSLAQPIINQGGVIEMPCGAGKTVFGINLAMTIGQPTLVVVHTHDILNGWLRELASKAVVPGGVGQVGAGVKKPAQVTVAMVQTLSKMDPVALQELLDQFGCIMLDECHRCPATTFLAIMNMSKSRYRYGLTATPTRKDELQFLMHDVIGDIVATVTDDELEQMGHNQSVDVFKIPTQFYTSLTSTDWTDFVSAIVNDADRNRLIVHHVHATWMEGHFPLVLSDRVPHCSAIVRALQKKGMNARLLVGSVPKEERSKIVEQARGGLVDAIVATSVADEGLDIPNLSCLHMTTPTNNKEKLKQRIGRIRRKVEGKESIVYDYVDINVTSAVNMFQRRRSAYLRMGFKTYEA